MLAHRLGRDEENIPSRIVPAKVYSKGKENKGTQNLPGWSRKNGCSVQERNSGHTENEGKKEGESWIMHEHPVWVVGCFRWLLFIEIDNLEGI